MALGDPNTNTLIARSLHSNIVKIMRETEVLVFRSFPVTDELIKRGRVKYNQGGHGFQWPVQYKLHPTQANDGTTPLTFPEHDQWLDASLGYRGFSATDKITEREMLENRDSQTRIVAVYSTMMERLTASMREAFKSLPYRDGSSSTDKLPQGIETFLSYTESLDINDNTDTAPSPNTLSAADLVAWPTATYAGLSCALGNYGGSYRSTLNATAGSYMNWPMGRADVEYDFWTPLIVNYDSDSLQGSTHTWAGQANHAIRFAKHHLGRNNFGNPEANLCVMERSMFTDLCALQETKERVLVGQSSGPPDRQYGMTSQIYQDDLRCASDYALDSRVAYIFNMEDLEYRCMYGELFNNMAAEDFDLPSQSYRYACTHLGNFKFSSPAKYAALKNVAT